jgi:hypothetical protein
LVAAAHHKSILVSPRRALQAEKFGLSVGGRTSAEADTNLSIYLSIYPIDL